MIRWLRHTKQLLQLIRFVWLNACVVCVPVIGDCSHDAVWRHTLGLRVMPHSSRYAALHRRSASSLRHFPYIFMTFPIRPMRRVVARDISTGRRTRWSRREGDALHCESSAPTTDSNPLLGLTETHLRRRANPLALCGIQCVVPLRERNATH